ncbi:hypothetical protein OSTOST_04520, partial [Ostertagia ostertagi]
MLLNFLLFNWLESSVQDTDSIECEFTAHVINSNTIAALENRSCNSIVGSIRIDETSDVTYEQLAGAFYDVGTVDGAVEVVNTTYTTLSFFR